METASVIERLKMQMPWGDVAQTRSFEYLIVSKPTIQISTNNIEMTVRKSKFIRSEHLSDL